MPELPEVETVCIGLSEKLLKLTVLDVKIINKKLRYQINSKNIKKIIKKKIKAVIRRGKNGLIIFSDNCILNFHLGMTGKFRIIKKKNNEKKHDHFIIIFNKNTKLIYNDVRKFGYVELIEKPLDLFQFKKLGVEPEMVKEQADVLFEKINRRNTNIKSILITISKHSNDFQFVHSIFALCPWDLFPILIFQS